MSTTARSIGKGVVPSCVAALMSSIELFAKSLPFWSATVEISPPTVAG
jgi:hypothetical protein